MRDKVADPKLAGMAYRIVSTSVEFGPAWKFTKITSGIDNTGRQRERPTRDAARERARTAARRSTPRGAWPYSTRACCVHSRRADVRCRPAARAHHGQASARELLDHRQLQQRSEFPPEFHRRAYRCHSRLLPAMHHDTTQHGPLPVAGGQSLMLFTPNAT